MRMKWMKNIIALKDGKVGMVCPVCGGKNIQYKETVLDRKTGSGYSDIWCEDCMNAFHGSRGRFDNPIATRETVPEGLHYC